jgi:hypothetical protein
MRAATLIVLLSLLALACGLQVAPAGMRGGTARVATKPAITMQLWAGKKKSRYEDDGSRLQGADAIGSVDEKLKGGLFSNFKWGTEVEVVGTDNKKGKKGKKAVAGMAKDNSDRGLGSGGTAYRNTETARFGALESQQIRKRNLEAYINSEEEASDGTFGKIISGSALLSIFGGLVGVYLYYGADGLMGATAGQRAIEANRQAGEIAPICASVDCLNE